MLLTYNRIILNTLLSKSVF